MKNVLIIGYGVVGSNMRDELYALRPDIVDKYKPEFTTKDPDTSPQEYPCSYPLYHDNGQSYGTLYPSLYG